MTMCLYFVSFVQINSDLNFVRELLATLNEEFPFTAENGRDWVLLLICFYITSLFLIAICFLMLKVLDANAAWSTEVMSRFISIITPFKDRIYMIEQPWPVDFLEDLNQDLPMWIELKNTYNRELDILLFADESMCTWEDVDKLLPFINGVNIKLEKTGGFRGALMAANAASATGLHIWCGVMVGSCFGSTATSHLLDLVSEGADLDGSLLVAESSSLFHGGVVWSKSVDFQQPFGYIGWPSSGKVVGIGCLPNKSEPLISLPV